MPAITITGSRPKFPNNMQMSKFQIILTAVFGLLIVVSVIVFSKYQGSGDKIAKVELWGTISQSDFYNIIAKTSLSNNKNIELTYREKNPETFDNELLEALAGGGGPDLFILPHDKIFKQKNKITIVPFSFYSERLFKDSFAEGAEIFLDQQGIIALPVVVDPLVMYWNRDIFNQVNLTNPPKYWDEFYNLASLISKKDGSLNVTRSAVAFGEFGNVSHAKEIISNLMMQAGTPITSTLGNYYISVMSGSFNKPIVPAEAAVNFYTEFSNPVKPSYSWNRSLPSSSSYFLGGDLAIYFGFASELPQIQLKNPNLNFDAGLLPTTRNDGSYVSYGRFYGLALSRGAKDPNAAFQTAVILSSTEGAAAWSEALNLPPVRRDLLARQPGSAYKEIFYKSAIRSKAWLDPDPALTEAIFKNMIESVTSGRERVSLAVSRASNELSNLFPR